MMKMQIGVLAFLVALSAIESGIASPNTVPAFLWSPHLQAGNGGMDEAVNYQVISAKDLVDSVFTQGGWSNILCSEKKVEEPVVDVALVFIGRELLSSDVSSKRNSEPSLVNTLNGLFTASNFSLAFPYIAAPEEERMESLLLSGLKQACPHNVGVSNIVLSDSCFVEDGTIQKLSDLQSFKVVFLPLYVFIFTNSNGIKILLSSDVSSKRNSEPSLVNTLNGLFTASNFSLAFPYIAAPEEERMESLLLSGLKQACPHNVGVSNIVLSDSCFVEDGTIQKLSDLQSFKDHLLSRKETRKEGETDLVVLCSEGSGSNSQSGQSHSERESISELVSSVEQSGSKYTALYVSDPYWYTSYKTLQRFLAESGTGNSTVGVATTCDELCKFKSSLLEGILVGIVFLLILISGLCCMAGIDTPTRFETPQDS
ncbi:hypothetical protein F2Q69_00038536 [Brassica cretica]|uniref:V-type proton ATPase subunit S1/VOA1 transmembrane domain-containing protein n=1 Tax=Brassica cretica TaxID=69181 RepID=A0A8S9SQM2_BRACR|nr:hypothetical protein F2Q69_00038536 [Brassica cretica]